jgi:uncharacterized integral membrane protein
VTTAKAMILLLVTTVILTTSTVLTTTLAHPSDTAEIAAGLLRLATAVSWAVMAVLWVGNRIMAKIEDARTEALGEIASLAERWGDRLLAAELHARLDAAEAGSGASVEWLRQRRST